MVVSSPAWERRHPTPRWLIGGLLVWLFVLLLLHAGLAAAVPDTAQRIAWRKVPIALQLRVGSERLVHFPGAVKVGLPASLQGIVRVQSIAGTVYLLAQQPFASARVVIRGVEDGRIVLLDVSAQSDGAGTEAVEIFFPHDTRDEHKRVESEESGGPAPAHVPAYGYVTLTRFAAQQLYAPARLLKELPSVVRVPVKRGPVALVRGDTVEAIPLIAWRAGDLFLTAVKLSNKTRRPQVLDPRTLRGRWLTATFQHNRLHRAGDEADRTVVYLISARPFAASL
jgi:integrating conjugative element protein (TIGR03749 family)